MSGLTFENIDIEHRTKLEPLLHAAPDRGCEYTFGNLYIWREVYGTRIALTDDGMCVVRFDNEVDSGAYLFPIGCGNLKTTVDLMLEDSTNRKIPFTIIAATKADIDVLEQLYPNRFAFHTSRDFAEYVYATDDLIELHGKKYHGKRNHISRFCEEYPDYEFVEISRDNIGEVREMNERWYRETIAEVGGEDGLTNEHIAVNSAFERYFELGFSGGFLCAGGEIVGYSMGEPINSATFCVHIEKACYNTNGAYTMVNCEFATRFCKEYKFINREDDVGDEGLRRSKLSYYPAAVTDKYVVHEK
ncbi:MAG: phosphatidylglycerol lysyltransferase domain-containing protein [Oscillospiraceae bacterium]